MITKDCWVSVGCYRSASLITLRIGCEVYSVVEFEYEGVQVKVVLGLIGKTKWTL